MLPRWTKKSISSGQYSTISTFRDANHRTHYSEALNSFKTHTNLEQAQSLISTHPQTSFNSIRMQSPTLLPLTIPSKYTITVLSLLFQSFLYRPDPHSHHFLPHQTHFHHPPHCTPSTSILNPPNNHSVGIKSGYMLLQIMTAWVIVRFLLV